MNWGYSFGAANSGRMALVHIPLKRILHGQFMLILPQVLLLQNHYQYEYH